MTFDLERMKEALASPTVDVPTGLSREDRQLFILISAIKPDSDIWKHLLTNGWTPPWQSMETAPKTGEMIMLQGRPPPGWEETPLVYMGSWGTDGNDHDGRKWGYDWRADDFDDWACGMGNTLLDPIAWKPIG